MPEFNDMKTIAEWCRTDGAGPGYVTLTRRRKKLGVGSLVPPRTWLLTRKEWEMVKKAGR